MSFLWLGQNRFTGSLPSEWGSGSWPQMYNLNLTLNQVWPVSGECLHFGSRAFTFLSEDRSL